MRILYKWVILFSCAVAIAQAPPGINYQTVIRNATGQLVQGSVSVRISVLQGSASGNVVYCETHGGQTNANGLLTLVIGNGTPLIGSFGQIDWSAGPYFLKTETDPQGQNNYSLVGTSQMLSVPYALYAEHTPSRGKTSIYIHGAITDAEALQKLVREYGPDTENIIVARTQLLTHIDLSLVTHLVKLSIVNNEDLLTVDLSGLTELEDSVEIRLNNGLTEVSFPSLTVIGNLDCRQNSHLQTVNFPALQNATGSDFVITENNLFTGIIAPNLNALGTLQLKAYSPLSFSLPNLQKTRSVYFEGVGLQALSLPQLNEGSIEIRSSSLSNLTLPSLAIAYSLAIANNPLLATINFPQLTYASTLAISENDALTSLSLSSLTTVEGFSVIYCSHVTSLNMPVLTNAGQLTLTNSAPPTLSFPLLANAGRITIGSHYQLTSASFPLLTHVDNFELKANWNLTTILLPLLDHATTFAVLDCVNLPSLGLPLLTQVNSFNVSNCGSVLTYGLSLNIPSLQQIGVGSTNIPQFTTRNNRFTTQQTNAILNKMLSVSPAVKIIDLRSNTGPSGQGIIDKQTLISQGCTVYTD